MPRASPRSPGSTAYGHDNDEAVAALAPMMHAFGELLGAERRLRGRQNGADGGLTLSQIRALMPLTATSEATAGELARAASLNPASVTAILDQLERSDVVRRVGHKGDRRVVVVSLTDHGRELMTASRDRWVALWLDAMADLNDDERAVGIDVLERITGLLEKLDASAE